MPRITSLLAALLFFIGTGAVLAAGLPEPNDFQVSPFGQVFAHYEYNVSDYKKYDSRFDSKDHNKFELDRAWLGLDATLTHRWSALVTLGAYRMDKTIYNKTTLTLPDDPNTPINDPRTESVVTGVRTEKTGRYGVELVYGRVRYQAYHYLGFDFGLIENAYQPAIEKFWPHTYLMEPLLNEYGFTRSPYGDLGAAFSGVIPGGYGGYRIAGLNGEGYRDAETNAGKAFEAQLHLFPFQKYAALSRLGAMGFYRFDKVQPDYPELTDKVVDALLSYRLDIDDARGFSVNGEIAQRTTKSGDANIGTAVSQAGSVWAEARFSAVSGLVARYDSFDPNTKNDKKTGVGYRDERSTILAGIWLAPNKYVRFCPNYRRVEYTRKIQNAGGRLVAMQPDQFASLNMELRFE